MNQINEQVKEMNGIIGIKNMEITGKDRLLQQKEIELQQKKFELMEKDKIIEELTNRLSSFSPDARMCTVKEFPDQVFVNREASMIVILKNSYGKLIGNNEDSLNIVIRNQHSLQEKIFSYNIKEIQNGCYHVSFTIKKKGSYSFTVLVHDINIHDFPRR